MRRFWRALLAFLVGFGGATAAVQALQSGTEDDVEVLGTPNFYTFCQERYDSTSAALQYVPGADGWRCATRVNGVFQLLKVDVDAMCEVQFGAPAVGRSLDPDDAESWQCTR